SGHEVYHAQPAELRRSVPSDVAAQLAIVMRAAVADGTARNAAVPGLTVAGLASTVSTSGPTELGWFVGYVTDAGVPVAATAVLVEGADAGDAARIGGQ